MSQPAPIGVYYEHPHWFKPLFSELERRGVPYLKLHSERSRFDPAAAELGELSPGLLFNRMSPSAWKRGLGEAIFYTKDLLRHLAWRERPVFNGVHAFELETSKALQASLLHRLGILTPQTRVVWGSGAMVEAARALRYPIVIKPNIGGSGAGIRRFEREDDLQAAVTAQQFMGSLDGIWLVQEYHPPKDQAIYRVETLEGCYLYGIRIELGQDTGFDLCPADICRSSSGEELFTEACPVASRKSGLSVAAYTPPPAVIAAVTRIAQAAYLDVGGIELLHSERDGQTYYYDINALSNFVADPLRVLGFDPTARLVEALLVRQRGGVAARPGQVAGIL